MKISARLLGVERLAGSRLADGQRSRRNDMARLKNLALDEFSIIRGSDVQPANPEATRRVYRSASNLTEEREQMAKTETTQPEAAQLQKSLLGEIGEAVARVFKGTRTIESTSSYSSQSSSTTTETSDEPAQPDVVVVTNGKETTKSVAVNGEVITKAVSAALAPVNEVIAKFDSRLAAIEKQSTGSHALKGSTVPPQDNGQVKKKFAKFEKFLEERAVASGLITPGQKLTKAVITPGGWTYGLADDEECRASH